MEESKAREKFVNLTEKRVTKAIKDLRLIGNLSNISNYKYDEKDVKKIISALDSEIKKIKQKFTSGRSPDDVEFKL
jgi:transcription elongation GreA/GreB family factor